MTQGNTAAAGKTPLFIGIDGGGSHCRAALVNANGALLGRGHAGSAHPRLGEKAMGQAVLMAVSQALQQAGLDTYPLADLHGVAGLAGLHLPRFRNAARQWQHPFASLALLTDLDVARLGAHGGEDGAVIIVGTGVSAVGVAGSRAWDVAGHGFPHSGKGGGHWLGYEAVTAILAAADHLGPPTKLAAPVYAELGLAQGKAIALADHFYQADAAAFARLAPLVLAAAAEGDPVALNLREQAVTYLQTLALQLLAGGVTRITLVGGVAGAISKLLAPEVQAALTPALTTPEEGAAQLARRQWCEANDGA